MTHYCGYGRKGEEQTKICLCEGKHGTAQNRGEDKESTGSGKIKGSAIDNSWGVLPNFFCKNENEGNKKRPQ